MSAAQEDIIKSYRDLVLQWDALRDEPRKANRIFRKLHAYYKQIREHPDGQRALGMLLIDSEASVRLLAATHLLPSAPDEAEPVLTHLEQGGGVYAMDARYTLMNFRAGKLDLDW